MKPTLRFTANLTHQNDEGHWQAKLEVIHKLNREEGLKYALENKIPVPNKSEFEGLDIKDPYDVNTKKGTREEALQMLREFIADFTENLKEKYGQVTTIDMNTGKLMDSESNV